MTKLSELTAATVLGAADEMPIKQSTTSKRSALSLIRDWITSNATGLSVASGTITASAPVTLTQTWNNGAVTFKGLDINVTDTAASAAASLLADFRSGGTSFAGIRKDGYSYSTLSKGSVTLEVFSSAAEVRSRSGTRGFTASNTVISLLSTVPLSWSSGTASFSVGDTNLYRDAAGQLALRNTTNAQSLAVYNTYTDASNYERLRIYGTAASAFTIASEAAGTGTARDIAISTGGTARIVISGTSNTVTLQNSSTLNLGGSGVLLVTNVKNSANDLTYFNLGSSTGVVTFAVGATNPRFCFTGTTSASPAIKRSGTIMQARLADDTAFATYQGKIQTDANAVSEAIVPTHTLTLYDAAGTAYKVAVQAA
jgi:hypothetical protein